MRNGRAIVRGVNINLRVHGTRWSGELQLPKGTTLFSGGYELHLNDRRAGRITIGVIDGEIAFFDGDGDLYKH